MKSLFFIYTFFMFIQETSCQMSLKQYLDKLDQEIIVSMVLQNQAGDVLFERNSQKIVPTASVIKIPILLTLLDAFDHKTLKISDEYVLTKSDKVGGSGEMQFDENGTKYNYLLLSQKMIAISDNTATNILIESLGLQAIQKYIKAVGLENTQLERKMMDFEAIKAGKQNVSTPQDINKLLLGLLNKKILSQKSGKKAIEILIGCKDITTIPRYLPKTIVIAHKSGTLDYIRGDAGIIFAKKTLVLSVFIENFVSQEQAETIIGKIAELSYLNFGK